MPFPSHQKKRLGSNTQTSMIIPMIGCLKRTMTTPTKKQRTPFHFCRRFHQQGTFSSREHHTSDFSSGLKNLSVLAKPIRNGKALKGESEKGGSPIYDRNSMLPMQRRTSSNRSITPRKRKRRPRESSRIPIFLLSLKIFVMDCIFRVQSILLSIQKGNLKKEEKIEIKTNVKKEIK